MSEEQKEMLSCDEALTIYLRDVSAVVSEAFYSKVLFFVMLYRECLSEYGWQKLAEAELRRASVQLDAHNILRQLASHKHIFDRIEFGAINNAEIIPEVSNEFVSVFMESRKNLPSTISSSENFDLTRHLCHWMFINGHTCSKLSLI